MFDKRLLVLGNDVYINLDGGTYFFDNDISGDAGVILRETGNITGNSKIMSSNGLMTINKIDKVLTI